MSIEKKTIRSDIPGSHVFLNGQVGYVGSTAEETSRLVVGREITLNGQIAACSYLVIEGIVEAQTFRARRMDILETGLFQGNAEVQDCVIAGRFEGTLVVRGRLTIKPTGQVCGEIGYGVLEVEAGATVEGQLHSIAAPVAVAAPLEMPEAPTADEDVELPEAKNGYRRAAKKR